MVVFIYKQGVVVPTDATKIIFDDSVTEIPNGPTSQRGVFSHCIKLRDVVLNEGLRRIGDYAFCGCTSLVIIKFPSTLTKVGEGAFYKCTNLREVVFNEGLQTIGGSAFSYSSSLEMIKLPSTVTEVGRDAFEDCTNLKEVELNEGLQKIGVYAFCDCTSVTSIKFPSTLTEVGQGAFYKCPNLEEVELNEGLQTIEDGAFFNCTSLNVVKFSAISKRAKYLIEAGQTDVEDKLAHHQHLNWRSGEYVVTPEVVVTISENWEAIRRGLDKVLVWIAHCELLEATSTIELALWKVKISEASSALTDGEREGCRTEVPGPVKDAILQYLDYNL